MSGALAWVFGELRLSAGPDFCQRHRLNLSGASREVLVEAIMDGTFIEGDPTPEESHEANLHASSFLGAS